eukprot:TRINITY_DN82661_c0_g1_i1.p1 TRINITY_DN82661_c0_g1~~TRINITY_DN82661_c0_g1_i1.p1  ORF type:complete len:404 (+),score=66.84 TRINITY_DN82661_c0_g1_i1:123-1334(+)
MPLPPPFVDYYDLLGCDPSTPFSELRKKYFQKLREFHPDKRQTSINGLGHKMTQQLNEAWAILSDQQKREMYDIQWRREKNKEAPHVGGFGMFARDGRARERRPHTGPPGSAANYAKPPGKARPASSGPGKWDPSSDRPASEDRAEMFRRQGNEMFKAAKALDKADSFGADLSAAAVYNYRAAIEKYSMGIKLAPSDHRLYSNRAICYAALKDWSSCQDDARKTTELKPDFMKGWFMLVKSIWKGGNITQARRELAVALTILPSCPELNSLKSEIEGDADSRGRFSRNPSPCGARPKASPPPGMDRAESCPPPRRRSDSPGPGPRVPPSSYRMPSPGRPPPGRPPPPPPPPPNFPPDFEANGVYSPAGDEAEPPMPPNMRPRARRPSLSKMAEKSRPHASPRE